MSPNIGSKMESRRLKKTPWSATMAKYFPKIIFFSTNADFTSTI